MNEPLTKEEQGRLRAEGLHERCKATWQDLEQRLASERQAHNIMDAAYWAVKERLDEQTAALGALAEGVLTAANALRDAGGERMDTEVWEEMYPEHAKSDLDVILRRLLAPDAVQQAVEAWKTKEKTIEHLQQLLRDAQFATLDTASDAETRLVHRLQDAEAKLAEFVRCIECGHEQADMGNNVACEECGGPMPTEEEKHG